MTTPPEIAVFHICTRQALDDARRHGVYQADSLRHEGFIHLSRAHQVLPTARAYFAGVPDLVLLVIDLGVFHRTPHAVGFRESLAWSALWLTLGVAFQADRSQLPTRLLTLHSKDSQEKLLVLVNQAGELVVEAVGAGTKAVAVIKGSKLTMPHAVVVIWDAEANELFLRARDGNGAVMFGQVQAQPPRQPLTRLQLGRAVSTDTNQAPPASDRFHGHVAELVLYSAALKPDQSAIVGKDLSDAYLQTVTPKPLEQRYTTKRPIQSDRKTWKLKSNTSPDQAELTRMLDGNTVSAWSTKKSQQAGQNLEIDLGTEHELAGVVLDIAAVYIDFPRMCKVETSLDGQTWSVAVGPAAGQSPITELLFTSPVRARHVRITQTGSAAPHWRVAELLMLAP
jgi:hypothetical protein